MGYCHPEQLQLMYIYLHYSQCILCSYCNLQIKFEVQCLIQAHSFTMRSHSTFNFIQNIWAVWIQELIPSIYRVWDIVILKNISWCANFHQLMYCFVYWHCTYPSFTIMYTWNLLNNILFNLRVGCSEVVVESISADISLLSCIF